MPNINEKGAEYLESEAGEWQHEEAAEVSPQPQREGRSPPNSPAERTSQRVRATVNVASANLSSHTDWNPFFCHFYSKCPFHWDPEENPVFVGRALQLSSRGLTALKHCQKEIRAFLPVVLCVTALCGYAFF